jgi:hypothetical protein
MCASLSAEPPQIRDAVARCQKSHTHTHNGGRGGGGVKWSEYNYTHTHTHTLCSMISKNMYPENWWRNGYTNNVDVCWVSVVVSTTGHMYIHKHHNKQMGDLYIYMCRRVNENLWTLSLLKLRHCQSQLFQRIPKITSSIQMDTGSHLRPHHNFFPDRFLTTQAFTVERKTYFSPFLRL